VRKILDKILFVIGSNDIPLDLLQSVLSPFLQIRKIIDHFHCCGNSSFSF
jgi:hypothetical protein